MDLLKGVPDHQSLIWILHSRLDPKLHLTQASADIVGHISSCGTKLAFSHDTDAMFSEADDPAAKEVRHCLRTGLLSMVKVVLVADAMNCHGGVGDVPIVLTMEFSADIVVIVLHHEVSQPILSKSFCSSIRRHLKDRASLLELGGVNFPSVQGFKSAWSTPNRRQLYYLRCIIPYLPNIPVEL